MDRKNKGFLKALGDAYKNLPIKMRVKVLVIAGNLLRLQTDNNDLLDNSIYRSSADEKEDGETNIH